MTLLCGRRLKVLGADMKYSNLRLSDDAPDWNSATDYVPGDRVRRDQSGVSVLGIWRIWECIQAHTNKNPNLQVNRNTFWVLVSAASQFMAFDDNVSQSPVQDKDFYYWRIDANDIIAEYIATFGGAGDELKVTVLEGPTVTPALKNWSSEAFNEAFAFTQVGLSALNTDIAPDPLQGMYVVDEIVENSATSTHGVTGSNTTGYTSGTNYRAVIYIRRGSGSRNARVTFPSAGFGANCYVNFTLSGAGSVTNSGGATGSITSLAGGWYKCFITAPATATGFQTLPDIHMLSGSTLSYAGNGTSSLYLFGFNVLDGNTVPTVDYVAYSGLTYTRNLLQTHVYTYPTYIYPNAASYNPNTIVAVPTSSGVDNIYEVQITNKAARGDRPQLGEIAFVYDVAELGQLIGPLDDNLLDFSVKERDDFGNTTLIQRSVADDINYTFLTDRANRNRVKAVLKARRAEPLVFLDDADLANNLGVLHFGFIVSYAMPLLPSDTQIVSLDTEGLT